MTIRSARRVLSLVAVLSGCLGLFGCGLIPIFGGLTGLPTSITIPASVVLSATVGEERSTTQTATP
ncbi:hypothetical protein HY230_06335 [Candidatus Acetothermia bacterium]|nr:hypothetical protein [Candidatus Acetothermia bacterium]